MSETPEQTLTGISWKDIQDSVARGEESRWNIGPDGEMLSEGFTMNNLGKVVWVGEGPEPKDTTAKIEQEEIVVEQDASAAFTGNNYQWTLNESYVSGSANVTNRWGRDDSSFSQFQGTWNLDDATHDNEYYEVTIYNPLSTSVGKMIKWLGSYAEGSNSIYVSTEGMGYLENTTACTGVTFLRANSNNLTGVFTLYGIKG